MDKVQKVISDTREPVVPKATPAAAKPTTAPKVIEMPKEAIEPDDDAESEIVMEEPRGRNPVMDDPLLTWVRR